MALPCPVCREEVTHYDPAKAGTIKAHPCGHDTTFEQARQVYPDLIKQIEDELNYHPPLRLAPPSTSS